jgi:hypothetical protein
MTLRRMGERLMEQVAVTEARKTELDAATTTVPNALAALAKSMRATWRDAAVQPDGIHFSWGIERVPKVVKVVVLPRSGKPTWSVTVDGMTVLERPAMDPKKLVDAIRATVKALMGVQASSPAGAKQAAPTAKGATGGGGSAWFVGEPPGAAAAEASAHASMYREFKGVVEPKAKKVAAALGAKTVQLNPAMKMHGIANTFEEVLIADIPGFGKYVVSSLGGGDHYSYKLGVWDGKFGDRGVELPRSLWEQPVDKIVELIRAAYEQIAGKAKAAERAAKMDKLWRELVGRQEQYGSADAQFQTMLAAYQSGLHEKG